MPYSTKQQQAVLRCLESRESEALSAQELAEELRREGFSVGLATIYRQLERLEEAEAILLQDGGLIVPDIREGEQTMSEVWLALQQKKYGLGREAAEKIAPVPYRMDFRMN